MPSPPHHREYASKAGLLSTSAATCRTYRGGRGGKDEYAFIASPEDQKSSLLKQIWQWQIDASIYSRARTRIQALDTLPGMFYEGLIVTRLAIRTIE
ncbi:hypothetical protein LTS10_005816 [Elasticomyces elasticus]|nr:hypothetical protein LTS10_005816 [Elasticomyces elasticus]